MTTPTDTRPLLRPVEVAEQLAVTRKTIYRLIDRGDLRAVHVGGVLRIDPNDLHAYLDREAS